MSRSCWTRPSLGADDNSAPREGEQEMRVPPSQAHDPETGDHQIRQSRFWWISVVRGIFSLLLGTAVLFTRTTVRCSRTSSACTGS